MSVKKWFKDFFGERGCKHVMAPDYQRFGMRCVKQDCVYFEPTPNPRRRGLDG